MLRKWHVIVQQRGAVSCLRKTDGFVHASSVECACVFVHKWRRRQNNNSNRNKKPSNRRAKKSINGIQSLLFFATYWLCCSSFPISRGARVYVALALSLFSSFRHTDLVFRVTIEATVKHCDCVHFVAQPHFAVCVNNSQMKWTGKKGNQNIQNEW